MSTEANKQLVRRFFEATSRLHEVAVDDFFAAGYRAHFPGYPGPLDAAGVKQMGIEFYAAMPDMRHSVEDLVAEGDTVVARLVLTGTHAGPLMGVPASGRAVRIDANDFFRIQDGRVVEHWAQFDAMGLMQQIAPAAMPSTATA